MDGDPGLLSAEQNRENVVVRNFAVSSVCPVLYIYIDAPTRKQKNIQVNKSLCEPFQSCSREHAQNSQYNLCELVRMNLLDTSNSLRIPLRNLTWLLQI